MVAENVRKLAEESASSTQQIAKARNAAGFSENAQAGLEGGAIAGRARRELEEKTGQSVVTGDNFLPPKKERGKALPEPAKRAEAGS